MHKKQAGFSLIEILVSGAILASVLVALMMLLSYSAKSSHQAQNRAIAAELLQEGADFFRQERAILGWQGLAQVLEEEGYCLNNLQAFSTSVDDNVFDSFDSAGNCDYTELHPDSETAFKRVATVDNEGDTVTITITVTWLTGRTENGEPAAAAVNSVFYLKSGYFGEGEFVPVIPSPSPTPDLEVYILPSLPQSQLY